MAEEPVFEHEASIDETPASSPEQPSGQQPASAVTGESTTPEPTPSANETHSEPGQAPGAEKRIGQLTARARSLETELAEARARAAYLEGQLSRPAPVSTPEQDKGSTPLKALPPPPDPVDYEDEELYRRDYDKWWREEYPTAIMVNTQERLRSEQSQIEETKNRQSAELKAQERAAMFTEKLNSEFEKDPDFYTLVHDPRLVFLNGPLLAGIQDSEQPIPILRHLATNPQEGMRIRQLGDINRIAYELGKLETKLTVSQPENRISNAPAPINALRGNESLTTGDPLISGSDDEYFSKIKIM